MSLSKNTSTTRGSQHTPAEARKLALRLGALIENSERDERGRIKFNPIHAAMEEGLGAPCRLDRYVSSNRGTLFQKLCKYYSRSEEDLYMAKPRNGTWVIPQLAVLIVCYFWTEFQVHAADVYHRYITRDVSLAIEVGENVGATTLTVQDIDGVVSRRLEELLPTILGQLITSNNEQLMRKQVETQCRVARMENNVEVAIDRLVAGQISINKNLACLAVDTALANAMGAFECHYHHLIRTITDVDVEGTDNFDFRSEFNGFVIAFADVTFSRLLIRSPESVAALITKILNVTVEFARPVRRWSSLSTRTLFQACAVLRIREWVCRQRGLTYPDSTISREIQHSTYLNVRCFFSILCHIDRVWDEEEYDGGLAISKMVEELIAKFGADLQGYDVVNELSYVYGVKAPPPRSVHRPPGQQTIESFFHPTSDEGENEQDEDEDERPLARRRVS